MQVLLQLLACSKVSSCFCTAAGFWQWSQPLVQAGGASPKYLAMAAWRHLEQAAGQGERPSTDCAGRCTLLSQRPHAILA